MDFTFYELFWYFAIYAVFGWCVEVIFCTVTTGQWVNRGFLNGPVCPIYGFGMVIVLLCLTPLQHNLLLLFAGSFLLTSALELVTGFVLKKAFHTTWWDYSNEPFNIGGYVCLKFSLAWGLGGMAAVRLLHPPVAKLVNWIPYQVGLGLAVIVGLVFLVDLAATLTVLIGLERDLKELEKLAGALRRGSDAISQDISEAALAASSLLTEQKEELEAKLPELEAKRDFLRAKLIDSRLFGAGRLMRAFPAMQNLKHNEALSELMDELKHRLGR